MNPAVMMIQALLSVWGSLTAAQQAATSSEVAQAVYDLSQNQPPAVPPVTPAAKKV
jgi:hypothetical protein